MSATPPEAETEYSRGLPDPSTPRSRSDGGVWRAGLLAGGLLGALLLAVAEFTTLYEVRTPSGVFKTVQTGSHHAYAMLLLAALAGLLALASFRVDSRPALFACGAVGVIALLIALVGDLPDAHASGLVGSSKAGFAPARSRPQAGLYLETLGAIVLVITSGAGLLLFGPRAGRPGSGSRVAIEPPRRPPGAASA